ncbi:hypothetical protein KFE25_000362 [Diacronema lutheri]|uniref:Rhodanese domain-containing protein n=1 Tax=Diacronema lutheri TaxID=2081491 RepID=A0A8J6CDF6_DIALT|nr:hypothetical protein KFE25_000362 [Diacronema lutheri]
MVAITASRAAWMLPVCMSAAAMRHPDVVRRSACLQLGAARRFAVPRRVIVSLAGVGAPYELDAVRRQLAAGDAQLLDVREKEEWDAGHLAGALLVPLSTLPAAQLPPGVSATRTAYVHCKAGGRALRAAACLREMGVQDVVSLQEGYAALLAAGFPPA